MLGSLANRLMKPLGWRITRTRRRSRNPEFPDYVDPKFIALYGKYSSQTLVSWPGCYQSYQAALYVARNGIPGAIVECGCWRGGVAAIMAEALIAENAADRRIYLFDWAEGMPEPAEQDVRVYLTDITARGLHAAYKERGEAWLGTTKAIVTATLAESGYPDDSITFVDGDVMNTIPGGAPEQIALLRLDTDWYQSTKHEMTHLFPRLAQGGVLIIDDYWYWDGSRKAVDEYLRENNIAMALHADSQYHAVIGVKPIASSSAP